MSGKLRKALLLCVGIDRGTGGALGPIFTDGTFEYVPIPERKRTRNHRSYATLLGRHGAPQLHRDRGTKLGRSAVSRRSSDIRDRQSQEHFFDRSKAKLSQGIGACDDPFFCPWFRVCGTLVAGDGWTGRVGQARAFARLAAMLDINADVAARALK